MRKIKWKPKKPPKIKPETLIVCIDTDSLAWQSFMLERYQQHAAEEFEKHKHEYFQQMLDNLRNPKFFEEALHEENISLASAD